MCVCECLPPPILQYENFIRVWLQEGGAASSSWLVNEGGSRVYVYVCVSIPCVCVCAYLLLFCSMSSMFEYKCRCGPQRSRYGPWRKGHIVCISMCECLPPTMLHCEKYICVWLQEGGMAYGHVTYESCHISMSHVTYQWVMSHVNESLQEGGMAYGHVTYESFHISMSHVTYQWVMSHVNESLQEGGMAYGWHVKVGTRRA